jgi:hypothetical protein
LNIEPDGLTLNYQFFNGNFDEQIKNNGSFVYNQGEHNYNCKPYFTINRLKKIIGLPNGYTIPNMFRGSLIELIISVEVTELNNNNKNDEYYKRIENIITEFNASFQILIGIDSTNGPIITQTPSKTPNVTPTKKDIITNCQNIEVAFDSYDNNDQNNFNSWWLGWQGYRYGSDYWTYLHNINSQNSIISEGISAFRFYGQKGTNYPELNINGGINNIAGKVDINGIKYIGVDFPTHSITYHGSEKSKVYMKLIEFENNAEGNVIWELCDTIGGFGYTSDYGPIRDNNHPDNGNRYVKMMKYKLIYQNRSDINKVNQQLQFNLTGSEINLLKYMNGTTIPDGDLIINGGMPKYYNIDNNEVHEFIIDMTEDFFDSKMSKYSNFKINCNFYKKYN